jgi:hypothetical protein
LSFFSFFVVGQFRCELGHTGQIDLKSSENIYKKVTFKKPFTGVPQIEVAVNDAGDSGWKHGIHFYVNVQKPLKTGLTVNGGHFQGIGRYPILTQCGLHVVTDAKS